MRAATLILGSVAAASILIALAFILSGGDSSKAVTKTVTEVVVEGPGPADSEEAGEGGNAQLGGPRRCGKVLSVERTSCEVGEAVHVKYEGGTLGLLIVEDPESGEYLEFNCGEPTPVICKQNGGPATVSFGA